MAIPPLTTSPALLLDAIGSIVILGLGAWVLTLRPRSTITVALGAFCVAFGAGFALQNLFALPGEGPFRGTQGILLGLAAVAILVLAWSFPRPLEGRARSASAGIVVAALAIAGWIVAELSADRGGLDSFALGFVPLLSSLSAAIAIFAVRAMDSEVAAEARRLAALGGALALWTGYTIALGPTVTEYAPASLAASVFLWLGAGLWLLAALRGQAAPAARNVALLLLASQFLGLVAVITFGGVGGYGVMRLLMVLLLVRAILRERLLGLDVKLRWTISRGTVAGSFVAVFFVASEAAQQFLGETLQSSYLGILAAGALVFAIAPISRLAERLAATAVPGAGPDRDRPRHEAAFADAVRLALRGGLTATEEAALARIAEAHGLGPVRALQLRREVEAERAVEAEP